MPEGDSLSVSVYAMVQLDFALHLYMQAFSPAPTRTLSFVDNFMLVAPDPGQLAQTWTCLMAFLELWHMEADSGKTYSWSLSGPHRDQLRLLGFQCVFNATELGGHMTFGGRRSIAHQESRLARLDAKWDRLRLSKAAHAQKLMSLRTVFWPTALHGMEASEIKPKHIATLRSRALKALRIGKAGVNPLLRLSLLPDMTTDPGFFHVVRISGFSMDGWPLCSDLMVSFMLALIRSSWTSAHSWVGPWNRRRYRIMMVSGSIW